MPNLTFKELLSSYDLNSSFEDRDKKKLEIKEAFLREYDTEFQIYFQRKLSKIWNEKCKSIYVIFTPINVLLVSSVLTYSSYWYLLSPLKISIPSIPFYALIFNIIKFLFHAVIKILLSDLSSILEFVFDIFFHVLKSITFSLFKTLFGCALIACALVNLYLFDCITEYSLGNKSSYPDNLNYSIFNTNIPILSNYILSIVLDYTLRTFIYLSVYFYEPFRHLFQKIMLSDDFVEEIINSYIFLKNDKENCNSEVSNKISKKLVSEFQYSQDTGDLLSYLENAPEMLLSNSNKIILTEIIGLVKQYTGYRYSLVLKGLDKKAEKNQSQTLNYFPTDALSHAMEFINDVGGEHSRVALN